MPYDFEDDEHMMTPHRNTPRRGLRGLEAEPVRREPQVADGFTEHLDCYAAPAKGSAGASFGMVNDAHFAALPDRIAFDSTCYRVAQAAIGFGLTVMLMVLFWLYPATIRAAKHVAVNDSHWCTGFDGLSCKQQDTARE